MDGSKSKNHELIHERDLPELYRTMRDLVGQFHPTITTARIALVWRMGWKKDKASGHLVLGKCRKASDFDKAFTDYDFVILLNYEAWERLSNRQRLALLDYKLCHATGEE